MLLIGAGVIWLLVNLGYIPSSNLWALAHIWPILLIGAGLGLILRQYWSEAGIVISTLVVLGAVLAVVYAPQLGWADMPNWGWWGFDFNGSIAGSRVMESETREISGIETIDLQYPANVTIEQGTVEAVLVTADDNLLPQLMTEVTGGTLTIRNGEPNWNRRVNASKTVEINITVLDLSAIHVETAGSVHVMGFEGDSLEIRLDGAGSIELNDVNIGQLKLRLNGAGSVKASGSAESIYAEVDGVGSVQAEGLAAQMGEIHMSGLASAEVRVAQVLTVEIEGAGSVTYHGSPELHQHVDGLGSVKQAED